MLQLGVYFITVFIILISFLFRFNVLDLTYNKLKYVLFSASVCGFKPKDKIRRLTFEGCLIYTKKHSVYKQREKQQRATIHDILKLNKS